MGKFVRCKKRRELVFCQSASKQHVFSANYFKGTNMCSFFFVLSALIFGSSLWRSEADIALPGLDPKYGNPLTRPRLEPATEKQADACFFFPYLLLFVLRPGPAKSLASDIDGYSLGSEGFFLLL